MEMTILLGVIIFLFFGVLQVILFFKLWAMTNDVRELKNWLINKEITARLTQNNEKTQVIDYKEAQPKIAEKRASEIEQQDNQNTQRQDKKTSATNIKTPKQIRKGEQLENGKYKCYSGTLYIGDFAPEEIEQFNHCTDNTHYISKK